MTMSRFPEFDAFRRLLGLQGELEQVFGRPAGFDMGFSSRGVAPHVNVFTDRDHAVIRMEVPGVAPEDLEIQSEGRTLTLKGERKAEAPEKGAWHRCERVRGAFSRSLQLPAEYDATRAEASCRHGILTVRVPKKEEARPRQITVSAA